MVPLGEPLPSASSAVALSLLGTVTVQRPMAAAAGCGHSSAFWPWHWENMSCGILPFTLGCVPAITAFKGRMPVNPLLQEKRDHSTETSTAFLSSSASLRASPSSHFVSLAPKRGEKYLVLQLQQWEKMELSKQSRGTVYYCNHL